MLNLPKCFNPCSAALPYVKAVKVPTGTTETLQGTIFQGPQAESLFGRDPMPLGNVRSALWALCSPHMFHKSACWDVFVSQHTGWRLHMQEGAGGSVIPHSGIQCSGRAKSIQYFYRAPEQLMVWAVVQEQGLSSSAVYVHRGIEWGEITLLEMLEPLTHMLCSSSMRVL